MRNGWQVMLMPLIKKWISISLVWGTSMLMLCSAPGVVVFSSQGAITTDNENNDAAVKLGDTRKITYEVSDVGESYLKPTDYSKLGRHDHTESGINEWWMIRNICYNDTIVRNTYPYVISTQRTRIDIKTWIGPQPHWTTHSFYTLKMDAENITGLATGDGTAPADPWILPIMMGGANPQNAPGGWVNMSMYFTYLTSQEYNVDIRAGTHYANTHYGVNAADFASTFPLNQYPNDGWFMEAQGHFDFSRAAAAKFLGLPGTDDLRTEFNTKGAQVIADGW
ncbi:MAG: hypothetical protein QXU73_00005, partial [Thermoplasmata archaeon]